MVGWHAPRVGGRRIPPSVAPPSPALPSCEPLASLALPSPPASVTPPSTSTFSNAFPPHATALTSPKSPRPSRRALGNSASRHLASIVARQGRRARRLTCMRRARTSELPPDNRPASCTESTPRARNTASSSGSRCSRRIPRMSRAHCIPVSGRCTASSTCMPHKPRSPHRNEASRPNSRYRRRSRGGVSVPGLQTGALVPRSEFDRHATHAPAPRSHRGAFAGQSVFASHATHWLVLVSQNFSPRPCSRSRCCN